MTKIHYMTAISFRAMFKIAAKATAKSIMVFFTKLYATQQRWESVVDLRHLNDDQLKDIGLTRYDVEKEVRKYFL